VRTSFGVMRDRPALFVRVEDAEGAEGWGEVWCNFPDCGAEHRARLLHGVFAPLAIGSEPSRVTGELASRTAVLAIQSGEPGPVRQCIAGIDIALSDLAARRANAPLWRHLGATSPKIRAYASGISPESPGEIAAECRAQGHRAFKLKVGFGATRDIANLREMRATLGDGAVVMADANQAWDLQEASSMTEKMRAFDLAWLEEPLRADRPWDEWGALASRAPMPLAGGENIAGLEAFDEALAARSLQVIQPDVAKWGGISGCLEVARRTLRAGLRYCPHYLGGGIGLLASAHLLAAAGGDGMLEIDSNPNELRTLTCGPVRDIREGWVTLNEAPGLGEAPDLAALERFRVAP
jgi:L-alanine-DL-glutamate epimerase-like enolase superfamily enzyme